MSATMTEPDPAELSKDLAVVLKRIATLLGRPVRNSWKPGSTQSSAGLLSLRQPRHKPARRPALSSTFFCV
jgi:hypothetical protein